MLKQRSTEEFCVTLIQARRELLEKKKIWGGKKPLQGKQQCVGTLVADIRGLVQRGVWPPMGEVAPGGEKKTSY